MPLRIIRNDITRVPADAVVNAANPSLLGGGGVDGAIHRAAGPELRAYCETLGGCPVGQARITPAFRLPARYIIHTVGPVWQGGTKNEEALLAACYRTSLSLALDHGCQTVAFPLISAGAYGYPRDLALQVAVREINAFLLAHEMEVTLVVYDDASFRLSGKLFYEVRSYLDRVLPDRRADRTAHLDLALASMEAQASMPGPFGAARPAASMPAPGGAKARPAEKTAGKPARTGLFRRRKEAKAEAPAEAQAAPETFGTGWLEDGGETLTLDQRLASLDESFSQMLLRKIDEKGLTDAACYKRANVDRKLFSKIRSDPAYRPSKPTVLAFAIALELPLEETRDLLRKAGFALSHSNKFDVIIEYFILQGNYDLFQINETLFDFDQALLGA